MLLKYLLNPGYAEGVLKHRTTRLTGRAGLHIAKAVPACPATARIIRKVNPDLDNHHFGGLPKWMILFIATHFKETMTF